MRNFLRRSDTAASLNRSQPDEYRALRQRIKEEIESPDLNFTDDGLRVQVEYYVNEKTARERLRTYFLNNQKSSLCLRIYDLALKLLVCFLYVSRVVSDNEPNTASCFGCEPNNRVLYGRSLNSSGGVQGSSTQPIFWPAVLWVNRSLAIWSAQCFITTLSLAQSIAMIYFTYKGNMLNQILSFHFIIEFLSSFPFVVTIFWRPWRNLFIPSFLNCWSAKATLETIFNDFHRAMQRSQSALSQQLMVLSVTLFCLVFTSVCGIQHFQRAGHRQLDLFESSYLVIVTFSTVGYGDLVPDVWPSQTFMVVMICIALIVLPTQFEQLAYTWVERKKLGGSYSSLRAAQGRHVVVCSAALNTDTIMDFLNEFYAHPTLTDYAVVLLTPTEIDMATRNLLQVPMWSQRVVYIQGSCMKNSDLVRARVNEASACFLLATRNQIDKSMADEHTIVRSWAVKDFAFHVPQYVQLFRPENKVHLKFAENVVCEDEFKYALLSCNCVCPGVSTLVTLLLHTSRGLEGQTSSEEWQRQYGHCSGNEIYHIRLSDSYVFSEFEGKSFNYASYHSHRKYGVALVGVRPQELPELYEDTILLNPGPKHIMRKTDICFYMCITKEENSAFLRQEYRERQSRAGSRPQAAPSSPAAQALLSADGGDVESSAAMTETNIQHVDCKSATSSPKLLQVPSVDFHEAGLSVPPLRNEHERKPSILPVPDQASSSMFLNTIVVDSSGHIDDDHDEWIWTPQCERIAVIKSFPPVSPYVGVSPKLCYLLKEKKPLCCLQLAQACEHCCYRSVRDYSWANKSIILAADFASYGIYNFIVPLRAHFHSHSSLQPIILLLERRPEIHFLDAISYFPLVYWMLGSIESLDDLCRAGIAIADSVVVVNKEQVVSFEETSMADANVIVAVQTISKFFPNVNIIAELNQSTNMRFMQFRVYDSHAMQLSRIEQEEKYRGSNLSFMFRLPFSSGSVFSASMLDTLLYQAFVKDYLITFVRLLLGIDQAPGSGFLTFIQITEDDMWIRTYGRLYQKLCSTTCEIPIAIYRTMQCTESESEENTSLTMSAERAEIAQLVCSRLHSLGQSADDYDMSEKNNSTSHVLINPGCDMKLQQGDIIYLLRPSPFSVKKSFDKHTHRRKSIMSMCETQRLNRTHNVRHSIFSLTDAGTTDHAPKRFRSCSLRVEDILLKRSNSLKLNMLSPGTRRIASLEELGLGPTNCHNLPPSSVPLVATQIHGSIDLKVTPPNDENYTTGGTSNSDPSIPSINFEETL